MIDNNDELRGPLAPEDFLRWADRTALSIAGAGLPALVMPGHCVRMVRYLRAMFDDGSMQQTSASLAPTVPVARRIHIRFWSRRGGVFVPAALLATIRVVMLLLWFILVLPFRLVISAGAAVGVVARKSINAVPALVATIVIVFLTGDTWRILGQRFDMSFTILAALFLALGVAALGRFSKGRDNLGFGLHEFATMIDGANDRPIVAALRGSSVHPDEDIYARLGRLGKVNVWMVYMTVLLANLLAVTGLVALSLLVVGVVRIDQATTAHLMEEAKAHVIWHLPVGHMVLTRELVLLSLSLGALAALSYVVATLQDSAARDECRRQITSELRRVLACYAVYEAAWAHAPELSGVRLRVREPVAEPARAPAG